MPLADEKIQEAYHEASNQWRDNIIQDYKEKGKAIPWDKLPVYTEEPPAEYAIPQTKRTVKLITATDETFFQVNQEKLDILMQDVHRDMNVARYAAIQRSGQQYEEILKRSDAFVQSGTMTPLQAVEKAAEIAAEEGLNAVEYTNGRRVNVASYTEMALRTSARRTSLTAEGERRNRFEEHLVTSPTLHSTCDHCLKWQGKVLIDDVYADGKPDGKHPLLSEAVKDGFLHPNCRHAIVTYIEGITQLPKQSPYDETRAQYEAEQKQRYLERMIRYWKRREAIALTEEAKKEAGEAVKRWQDKMKEHLASHPQLRRNYAREKADPNHTTMAEGKPID